MASANLTHNANSIQGTIYTYIDNLRQIAYTIAFHSLGRAPHLHWTRSDVISAQDTIHFHNEFWMCNQQWVTLAALSLCVYVLSSHCLPLPNCPRCWINGLHELGTIKLTYLQCGYMCVRVAGVAVMWAEDGLILDGLGIRTQLWIVAYCLCGFVILLLIVPGQKDNICCLKLSFLLPFYRVS